MNKKVFILIIIVVLLTVFNVLQYDKMRKTEIEHQLEIDSLTSYSERLEQQLDILTEFIVDDEFERAKISRLSKTN